MQKDSSKIKLIAHRGGKGYALENTIPAFKMAMDKGYYGIECDIQLTKDKEIVIYHDLNLKRLANIDKMIKDVDYSYLKELQLSKIENGITYTGKIPLLKELLEIIPKNEVIPFIELKETYTYSSAIYTVDYILKYLSIDDFYIIANSASIDILVYLRKKYPKLKMMFVARTNYEDYITKCLENSISFDCALSIFNEENKAIKYCKMFTDKGLSINLWVIDTKEDYERAIKYQAKYLTTNILEPGEIK